jgi:diguanylate cyclase (GGDEF)-like protein
MAALLMLCGIAVVHLVSRPFPTLYLWVQAWSLVCTVGLVVVYALIRSGFSRRWRDPAMTLFQITSSLTCAAFAYVIAGPERNVVLPMVAVILVFGAFGLSQRQMVFVMAYGLALFALAVAGAYAWHEGRGPSPAVSWATLLMTAILLGSSTLLNLRIAATREKLQQQKRSIERERSLAMRDALTGLPNRRYMQDYMQLEAQRAQRAAVSLLIAQLDLDHFKAVNDTHGHAAGDEVLRAFAARVGTFIRASDVLARWGGEEFVLMMTQATPEEGAGVLERVRAGVAGTPLALSTGIPVPLTVSIGAAQRMPGESPADWLHRADMALYAAKSRGRNRVAWAQTPESCRT